MMSLLGAGSLAGVILLSDGPDDNDNVSAPDEGPTREQGGNGEDFFATGAETTPFLAMKPTTLF